MTSTILHDNPLTGEIPTTPPTTLRDVLDRTHAERAAQRDARRHAWIAEDRPTGRHRAGRGGPVHVTAIAGVDLARRPVRLGAGAKTPTHGLPARLLGGAS